MQKYFAIVIITITVFSAVQAQFTETILSDSDPSIPFFTGFGTSVATDDSRILIGAPSADSLVGAAFIFELDGGTWTQQAKLVADDGEFVDAFGYSVDIDGNVCVIGAPGDDGLGNLSGAAYVFEFNGTSWEQVSKFLSVNADSNDFFGNSVAIYDSLIVIGMSARALSVPNINGYAMVYQKSVTGWQLVNKIEASDKHSGDYFGHSVDIHNKRIVVGAGNNGVSAVQAGAAYIFEKSGAIWEETQRLSPDDAHNHQLFGSAVSIYENSIIVGAPRVDTGPGAVYAFEYDETQWMQNTKFFAGNPENYDGFGRSIDHNADHAIIGSGRLVNDSGAVYVHQKVVNNWEQVVKITGSDTQPGDGFGGNVTLFGAHRMIAGNKTNPLPLSYLAYVYEGDFLVSIENDPRPSGNGFDLAPNYPNPFNPTTTIEFQLPVASRVTLGIHDILGRHVTTPYRASLPAGTHQYSWDATDANGNPVASGVYFYRLSAGDFQQVRKMLLVR